MIIESFGATLAVSGIAYRRDFRRFSNFQAIRGGFRFVRGLSRGLLNFWSIREYLSLSGIDYRQNFRGFSNCLGLGITILSHVVI